MEILKTGASSVYGSDAIAGVVNLITKKDIRGLQVRGFSTMTTHDGGGEYSLSGIYGLGLGDRGHLMVSANYDKQQALTRGDRGFLGCEQEHVFSQATGKRADPINPNTGQPYCGTFPNDVLFLMTSPITSPTTTPRTSADPICRAVRPISTGPTSARPKPRRPAVMGVVLSRRFSSIVPARTSISS